MRTFSTAGPVALGKHYSIPPLERWALESVLHSIRHGEYFVLHAPRQTGKTSTLLALQDLLNSGSHGEYRCVYANIEAGQASREDVRDAMQTILDELGLRARLVLRDEFVERAWPGILERSGPNGALKRLLSEWAEADPRPLVLLLDEIDALVGDTLLSVLRQIRTGYPHRPGNFPQSIVLCGVRDVRNYRIHSSSEGAGVAGGSAFNIKAESLRLGDFGRPDVEALLGQHTTETGQTFLPEALDRVWTQTQGQPWLVNALCDQACFQTERGRDRDRPITEADILEAQEQLILKRVVHLDQLADKLREDRVRRVIEPLLSGTERRLYSDRDLEYARDLGLIPRDDPSRMANPIYTDREWRRPDRTRVWPRPEHTELLLTWTQGKRIARFGASAVLALLSRRGAQAHQLRCSADRQPQSLSRVGLPQSQGIRVSALD